MDADHTAQDDGLEKRQPFCSPNSGAGAGATGRIISHRDDETIATGRGVNKANAQTAELVRDQESQRSIYPFSLRPSPLV
jgi:hypothetical protein